MRVILEGLNYKTAPVEVRERFSFSQSLLEAGLSKLCQLKNVEECLILSTCNRVEIYAASEKAEECVEDIKIGSQAVSVSYAAVELAKRIFDDLSKRTVMVIGTGDMAELAMKHLVAAGIKDLVIANRTFESAESLAYRLKGKAIRIEEVHYFLRNVDIVITATGSSDFIIRPQHVREALNLRKNEPMFMIDIAVPRDIDPRVEEIPNIYLYDIDDLNGVLDENLKIRREHAKRAEEIVLQGEQDFQKWINGLSVVPAIISLRKRFEEIKDVEVQKALRRLSSLSERERNIIEGMAAGIIGKILHNPVTNLKRETATSLGSLYVGTLNRLFELDEKDEFLEEENDEASAKDWE